MFLLLLSAISLANARPQGAADIGNSGSTNTLTGELLKLSSHDEIFNDALPEENLDHQPSFWEGDIMMTEKQRQIYTQMSSALTFKKALISDTKKLWPGKTVPYIYASEIDAAGKRIVETAMKHWREHTCLDFVPRTTQEDYVEFVFLGGCASYVGRIGGKQIISIGSLTNKCKVGNLIHELGHCIGFYHEQSRPDRDSYVTVLQQNIRDGFEQNFMKMKPEMIDSKNVPYDYGSIMHYPKNFFSISRDEPTIRIRHNTTATVGQRKALSGKDILQAKLLYDCQ